MEIEVSEICNRFGRAVASHLTRTYETSEALRHFNVHQVGRVKLVLISNARATTGE